MAKKKLEPALVDYWSKLTQTDITLINYAVSLALERDNPGALPFLKVETAVACLDFIVKNNIVKKGPYYRMMHKLESWKYNRPVVVRVEESVLLSVDNDKLLQRIPIARRQRINARKWRSHLPFVKSGDGFFTAEIASCTTSHGYHYYFTVANKHLAGLMAWLEGARGLGRPPKRKTRQRKA